MKTLFLLITTGFLLIGENTFAQNAEDPADVQNECTESEEDKEECRPFKFRRPPSYENSVIVDPIERDQPVLHPSSRESSFYEMMTR